MDGRRATLLRFLIWSAVIGGLWLVLSLQRGMGRERIIGYRAGFPWEFATWDLDRLASFDQSALTADVLLGLLVTFGVAGLCAWSAHAPRNSNAVPSSSLPRVASSSPSEAIKAPGSISPRGNG